MAAFLKLALDTRMPRLSGTSPRLIAVLALPAVALVVGGVALGLALTRHSGEGAESSDSGEESGTQLSRGQTFDQVRAGVRLIVSYDAASKTFTGTAANTTSSLLDQVRIEIHLSNGVELGPTTPVDLAAGQTVPVTLPASAAPFQTWSAHAEVGASASGGGEHSAGGERSEGAEHSSGSESRG